MFASLFDTATPLLGEHAWVVAAAVDEGSDSWLWAALSLVFLIVGAGWLLVRALSDHASPHSQRATPVPPSAAPRSRRPMPDAPPSTRSAPPPSSRPAPPSSARVSRSARPIPRRVILLHEVTPGQSCDEYNVGDNSGTRGSALVRVA